MTGREVRRVGVAIGGEQSVMCLLLGCHVLLARRVGHPFTSHPVP